MTSPFALALFVSTLVWVGIAAFLWRRASRARQALQQAIHDRSLDLDRRCDVLQDQVDTLCARVELLILERKIERLSVLVDRAETGQLLGPAAATALRGRVRELYGEALDRRSS